MRCLWLVALLGCIGASYQAHAQSLEAADQHGTLGDTGSLLLFPSGAYFSPIYNDIAGQTDKLLTQSTRLGYLHELPDEEGWFDVRATWRMYTPSFHRNLVDRRSGRFVDWLAVDFSRSKMFSYGGLRWKRQISLGLSEFGIMRARNVQATAHKLVHNAYRHLTYDDQPKGAYGNFGYESGAVFSNVPSLLEAKLDVYAAWGAHRDKMMTETYLRLNVQQRWSESLVTMMQTNVTRQLASEVLERLRPYRYEASIGALFGSVWRPSVSYVLPYLIDETRGQLYVDLLTFVWSM